MITSVLVNEESHPKCAFPLEEHAILWHSLSPEEVAAGFCRIIKELEKLQKDLNGSIIVGLLETLKAEVIRKACLISAKFHDETVPGDEANPGE